MTTVTVLIPVLNRPHRVEPLLKSLISSQRETPLWPLFLCSPGDEDEIEAVRESGEDYVIADWEPGSGDYARKINLGASVSDAEWLFMGADDLRFEHGWAECALETAEEAGARVVGTDDLGNGLVKRGKHATHMLFARSYVDECGTIDESGRFLHEGYGHWYVDNEAVETAKARGEWAFCREARVEHMHPLWGKSDDDWVYEKGRATVAADRRLFQLRRRLWAGRHTRAVRIGSPSPG